MAGDITYGTKSMQVQGSPWVHSNNSLFLGNRHQLFHARVGSFVRAETHLRTVAQALTAVVGSSPVRLDVTVHLLLGFHGGHPTTRSHAAKPCRVIPQCFLTYCKHALSPYLFLSRQDMQRQRISLRVHHHGRVVQRPHGARHPTCDLTAVGDENLRACKSGRQTRITDRTRPRDRNNNMLCAVADKAIHVWVAYGDGACLCMEMWMLSLEHWCAGRTDRHA